MLVAGAKRDRWHTGLQTTCLCSFANRSCEGLTWRSPMAAIALREITTEEQNELREMVAAYWAELVPDAPVAHDPRRAAAYFAEHFRFGDDTVSLWWVLVDAAKVGFVRVDRWSTEDERGGFIRDFFIG